MKVCPVCNESFGNELNFCDVDGVRLKRERVDGEPSSQNKLWQLLGVGLLLGALVLSVVSVFLPKSRVVTVTTNSESAPASSTPQPSAAQSTPSEPQREPDSELQALTTEEIALSENKKKEKPTVLLPQPDGKPGPDPKAAALDAEEKLQPPAPKIEEPRVLADQPKKVEPTITTKSASDARDNELKPIPAAGTERAEPKKASDSKSTSKDSKKKEDEKGKKKGGFLRVFKKIFGKD
jgi:hypothetical protein